MWYDTVWLNKIPYNTVKDDTRKYEMIEYDTIYFILI